MYDDPKTLLVFLHGSSPNDWHSPSDVLDMIARIDADKLLAMGGYASVVNPKYYSGPDAAMQGQSEALQYRVDCLWRDKPWVKMMRERWAIQDGDFHDWSVIGRSMEYLWHVMFNGKPIRERHYDADS